ncbi:hypothetical protein GCM10009850_097170 [Nonomuraea monospora]|uniref:HEAT repeat domain-containing protein n=1 Tax=Nonomuraea monospora TaxID=568818 RepID=A0ABP5PRM8_9ACTN
MIFEGVDDIRWGELTYTYSGRCDIPALLRSLLTGDQAFEAADELLNELHHQGGFVCTAAPAILPFLVEAAESPRVPCRPEVLEIIARLAGTAAEAATRFVAPGWPQAWVRTRPSLLALLRDQDPAVRTGAIWALGEDTHDPDEVAQALVSGWPDPDVSVRTDALLALGALVKRLSAAVLPAPPQQPRPTRPRPRDRQRAARPGPPRHRIGLCRAARPPRTAPSRRPPPVRSQASTVCREAISPS